MLFGPDDLRACDEACDEVKLVFSGDEEKKE